MSDKKIKAANPKTKVKYSPSYPSEIAYICFSEGKITESIAAKHFKCGQSTIELWKKKHPEFKEAFTNPMSKLIKMHAHSTMKNALHGREEKDGDGNVTKMMSPTSADIKAPVDMGYINVSKYTKNQEKEELKKERKLMAYWVDKYNKKEISPHQLMTEYYNAAIEPPENLVKEIEKYDKDQAQQKLKKQRKAMRHWIDKYNNSDINLSQLLTEYYSAAIEPPLHLVKEHANALATGTLEIVAEEDTYDQAHAARILAAKKEREEARIQRAIEEGINERLAEIKHQSNE